MGRACRSGKRRLLTADKESCRSLPVIDARTPTAGFSIFDFDAYGSPLEHVGAKKGMARLVVDRAVDRVRDRFGWEAIGYASVALGASRSVPDMTRSASSPKRSCDAGTV